MRLFTAPAASRKVRCDLRLIFAEQVGRRTPSRRFLSSPCARDCAFGCGSAPHQLLHLTEMLSRNLHEGPSGSRGSTSVGDNVPVVQFPSYWPQPFRSGPILLSACAKAVRDSAAALCGQPIRDNRSMSAFPESDSQPPLSRCAALSESQIRRPTQNRRKVETVTRSICAR
jgi:hypothetical protein